MIALSELTADLQLFWQAAMGSTVPTQFPGVPLDAGPLRSWMEFWVTAATEPARRTGHSQEVQILIDVHCFSRQRDKRAVFRLADQVRSTLTRQLIPLPGSTTSDTSPAAFLRLREAVSRDLTRESTPAPKLPLQHLLVSVSGLAVQGTLSDTPDDHV